MASDQSLSIVLGLAVAIALWLNRRRWLTFTCVGVFTVFFLLMNYAGAMLTIWGYEWRTLSRMPDLLPLMTSDQRNMAVLMVNAGLLSVWAGVFCCERLWGTPEIHANRCVMKVSADSEVGINTSKFWPVSLIALAAFFYFFNPLAGSFLSIAGRASVTEQLQYRLEATDGRSHYGLTLLAYNVLPYVALVGAVLFWRTRQFLYLLFLPFALLGKFVYLHKEPVVVYLLHMGVIYSVLASHRDDSRSGISWFKIGCVCALAFTLLPMLYIVVLGYEWDEVSAELFIDLALGSLERITGRMSNSYFYFAHFFPERYPHHGFAFVKTFGDLLGTSHVAVNKEVYYELVGYRERGSIASDNLVNLYGGFGLTGLMVGGFLQGCLLAWLDRWFSRRPNNLGWFVLYSFVVTLCITLNQAHIFGVVLGYGGVIFVALAYWMNTMEEGQLSADAQWDGNKAE